jgi:hypothetical protein
MPSGQELFVELPVDSTGKSVRTLQVTTLINNVPTVVNMEVMSVADADGNIILDIMTKTLQQQILDELRRIRVGIGKLCGDPLLADDGTRMPSI